MTHPPTSGFIPPTRPDTRPATWHERLEALRYVPSLAKLVWQTHRGLALAMAGLAAGLIASWGLARTASTLLFGVGAADPPTLVAVSALALAVAAAASYLPARRAARISPIVALRRRV